MPCIPHKLFGKTGRKADVLSRDLVALMCGEAEGDIQKYLDKSSACRLFHSLAKYGVLDTEWNFNKAHVLSVPKCIKHMFRDDWLYDKEGKEDSCQGLAFVGMVISDEGQTYYQKVLQKFGKYSKTLNNAEYCKLHLQLSNEKKAKRKLVARSEQLENENKRLKRLVARYRKPWYYSDDSDLDL